jgi:hypothetical protein
MSSAQSFEKRFEHIYASLQSVYQTLDDLMEDPIFIDNIHGEQEIALDQAADLMADLLDQFDPQEEEQGEPVRDSELYDVT